MAIYTNQAILTYNEGKTTLSNVAVGELTEPVAVTKTAVNNDYIYGDDVTYVITITNSGPSAITSLTVTDNFGAYPYGPIPITVFPLTYVGPVLYYVNGVRQADIVRPSIPDPDPDGSQRPGRRQRDPDLRGRRQPVCPARRREPD
jgi:hypothetical protein